MTPLSLSSSVLKVSRGYRSLRHTRKTNPALVSSAAQATELSHKSLLQTATAASECAHCNPPARCSLSFLVDPTRGNRSAICHFRIPHNLPPKLRSKVFPRISARVLISALPRVSAHPLEPTYQTGAEIALYEIFLVSQKF